LRRTLKTYSKGAPFYTASSYPHVGTADSQLPIMRFSGFGTQQRESTLL
jgi:hypothetical protein